MHQAPTSGHLGSGLRGVRACSVGAVLATAGFLSACSDDPTEPGEGPLVQIASVEPESFQEGATAVVHGSELEGDDLTITIAGLEAEILSSDGERAEVEVPVLCRPVGDVEVAASRDPGVPDTILHPTLGSGPPTEMDVGEFMHVEDPEDFCLLFEEAAPDEAYAFGVQYTGGPSSLTPVWVSGGTADGATAVAARSPGVAQHTGAGADAQGTGGPGLLRDQLSGALEAQGDPTSSTLWEAHHRAEASIRQRDRRILAEAAPAGDAAYSPAHAESPEVRASEVVPEDLAEGDTVEIRVPDLDEDSFCQEYIDITTVAEVMGDEAIWLVDVEDPEDEGFDTDDYQDLSNDFDATIYPALEETFGEPAEVGGLGRQMVMVVSQAVNGFDEAPLGFVVSCDFLPPPEEAGSGEASFPSSDFGNLFYLRAPGGDDVLDRERALLEFPRLLAHEATHVIQFGRRITADQPLPEVWELEGQAVLGEEVAGHRELGNEPRQNLSIGGTALPNGVSEADALWYYTAFFDLFRYFGLDTGNQGQELTRVDDAPEECSWLEQDIEDAPCEMGRREPYGVAWTFLRWLGDQFHDELPDGEATLHRELIDSGDVGFSNVEGATGESSRLLLAQWAATLYADGRIEGDGDPRIDFPSWDLAAMDQELVPETHLQPRQRSYQAFDDELEVRGGSSSYFVLSGSSRPATGVRARTLTGDFLPSATQMWVVRLR